VCRDPQGGCPGGRGAKLCAWGAKRARSDVVAVVIVGYAALVGTFALTF
jgi:hypothetical protein